uniref:Aspartyl/asparaginy/proline hydroxylase domain-containing protein n=1 Tax=Glossina morsitans morsitans TaxID=37546 RepID=A0A1B0G2X2_GLOMM
MSGDVQPRKRKDKKKKRDGLDRKSDGEITFSRKSSLQDDEASHGVHITKMGTDDVLLHVQHDHGTGGHWCAKIIFFSLMAVLLGLVALIIMENRDSTDMDTPLSESRFSNYFDGWVEEHRQEHDDHDDHAAASVEDHDDDEHDEEHDDEHDDEPYEEVADVSEGEEEVQDATEEQTGEDDADEEEEDEQKEEEIPINDNDEDDENITEEKNAAQQSQNDEDEDDDEDDENVDENITAETSNIASNGNNNDNDSADKQEDEEDDEDFDDGAYESLENLVDNDAGEFELLQEKARQQAAAAAKHNPPSVEVNENTENADMALKIGIGFALASVARLVLIRKNPMATTLGEDMAETLMKRRLTIATDEEPIPESGVEEIEESLLENDYSEEEFEIEEEIEYLVDEEEQPGEEGEIDAGDAYVPETFEQLEAMYRSKGYKPESIVESDLEITLKEDEDLEDQEKEENVYTINNQTDESSLKLDTAVDLSKIVQSAITSNQTDTTCVEPNITPSSMKQDLQIPDVLPKDSQMMDYQPVEEVIDYDEDDIYDDEEEAEDNNSEDEVLNDNDDVDEEDDISEVDDTELMNRLEAKYGKLPAKEYESDEDPDDPSWTQIKPKSGPRASDDDFDVFEQELRRANEEMLRELYPQALQTYEMLIKTYPQRIQLQLAKARALDAYAEQQKSNQLLRAAIDVYKYYLQIDKKIANVKEYKAAAKRCLERMKFLGQHQDALPLHQELIKRFPQDLELRQQLAVTYLLINRFSEAKKVLEQLLQKWPDDGFALVHYGFVLKQYYLKYEKAVDYLQRGIASKAEGTQDGRFYFQLGDALQRLGREEEAFKIYKQGADLKLFPSIYQRSLYNEPGLKAQPFWSKNETGYQAFFYKLEQNWLAIKAEGLNILSKEGYFIDESENLKDQGDWKQFELYARGQQIYRNCLKAPITCSLIEGFPVARQCRRGQVKFSIMHEGTHVWPHCGPTNCRLRAHLGLVVPEGTWLRVAEEESTWHEGKFLIFDDSFEHEVWHNGTGIRLVLIVDVWHPDLTLQKRRSLTAI